MKIKYYSLFLLLFIGYSLYSQTKKILFVGNSYTYANDLPNTIKNLALSGGDTITVDSSTPGGYTFQLHTTNATTLAKINSTQWDYVVLQEQSQLPSFEPVQVQSDVYPYAYILDSLIHKNNACTQTVFYMTWGRKYGDASNCAFYPPVCTFEGMGARLRQSYLEMGDMFECAVAPAGMAWKRSRALDSTINLWSSDNSHPSVEGTYLTACVFYSTIFQKHSAGLSYISGINAQTANFLQLVADSTVFDSLTTLNIKVFDPKAGFSWVDNGAEIQFTNESINANSYQWFFGDGMTDNSQNPSHIYSLPGIYNVKLICSDGCLTDTICDTVSVFSTGLCSDVLLSGISIYPNPATDAVKIKFPDNIVGTYFIELDKIDGQMIQIKTLQFGSSENEVIFDTKNLESGIYFIRIDSSKGAVIHKLVKL
ncbi:MAG: T9SS type A sorting domain-containing protein [Bacteroidia bacterium]|nr:T9SS type A sorting domain-containing protein [Bacteroidia bacterium]